MRKILRAGPQGPRDELLFILGINTALRIGDLLRLTFGGAFQEKGKIRKAMALREQKSGKPRKTPLNKTAREALKGYRDGLLARGEDPGPAGRSSGCERGGWPSPASRPTPSCPGRAGTRGWRTSGRTD
jgi:integrase